VRRRRGAVWLSFNKGRDKSLEEGDRMAKDCKGGTRMGLFVPDAKGSLWCSSLTKQPYSFF
jgi:hypothetical protein